MPANRQRDVAAVPLSHSRNVNVTPARSSSTRDVSQLKGTPGSPLSPRRNLNPHIVLGSEENRASHSSSTQTTVISPELANVFASLPVESAFLLSSNPSLASEFVQTFNSSYTQSNSLAEKLALLRKAGSALSPRNGGPGTKGTFRHARGVVEGGGEGLERCVKVFEEKYGANMKGMKEDIESFCRLRMGEFRRTKPLSRLEEREMDRLRKGFGGERVHCWAFSALKEMAMEDDDNMGDTPRLRELYAFLEAEAFVQQVAGDQAKVGADAALEADLIVGCAVESALSSCADAEILASRIRVRDGLALMRQIAVDELIDVDPKAGGELLHVCADLEVRLAGYEEDSEQVLTTKYYAGLMERMDN